MRLFLLSLVLVFCVGMTWAYEDYDTYYEDQDRGGRGHGHNRLCGDHYCPRGYSCETKHGHYICRRDNHHSGGAWTTGWTSGGVEKECGRDGCCKEGQYCAKVDGKERCVYYPDDKGPQCGGSFCRENQICVLQNGVLGCLDSPDSNELGTNCGLFHCDFTEYCIMVNGYLQCLQSNGTAPFACGLTDCVPPELCVTVDGCKQCVHPPRPAANCGIDKYCHDGEECIRRGLEFVCVPKRETCDTKSCTGNTVCIEVNGEAQCVVPPVGTRNTILRRNLGLSRNVQPIQRNVQPIQRNVKPVQHNVQQQHAKPAQQQQHAKPAAKPVQHNVQQANAKPVAHIPQQQHVQQQAKPVQHNVQHQQVKQTPAQAQAAANKQAAANRLAAQKKQAALKQAAQKKQVAQRQAQAAKQSAAQRQQKKN